MFLAGCQGPPSREAANRPSADGAGLPLHYSLGSFDRRFGITPERFLEIAAGAKSVWEKSAGRPLFVFDTAATFRLNLVYDERQERTDEARRAKSKIDSRGKSYDMLVWQHTRQTERVSGAQAAYEADAAAHQRTMNEFNARIAGWNEAGGAPPGEYEKLQVERRRLEERGGELERRRVAINADVEEINRIASEINQLVAENHLDVTLYNGKFVEGREFEQGVYDGRGINIYQFGSPVELRMALIHEFGHALGFEHVDDPSAIMYYRFEMQDRENPRLTEADLALVRKKFANGGGPAG
jgi:hypothetical protein